MHYPAGIGVAHAALASASLGMSSEHGEVVLLLPAAADTHGAPPSDGPLQDVNSAYTLGKVLGRGQFGVTRLAECKSSGDKWACKTISKRKLS